MDSKEYWLKREQEHAKELRKTVANKTEEIMKEYKRTLDNIEADINRNFVRYAKDGNMTMADAMKLADKMDVVRFADKAKQYVQEMDNSPQVNADLKLYNLKMRVSLLQLLKSEINLEIDRLAGKLNDETEKHLRKVAMSEYRRQAGILGKHLIFNDRKVNALVNASYKLNNGFVTFSNNVWRNTEELKMRLGNALNSAILQGKNPNQYISEFIKIFNAQPYQVGRLLITETARLQGDVQLDSYKQGEIEWYDISYESSACRICRRAAAGGPYRFDRAVIGHNMYPFHPNCLCSIMPAEKQNDFATLTRKKLSKKRKVINRERQRKLTEDFRRRGGIIQQDEEGEAYLASRGDAAGITLDEGTIVLHIRPTISEILEELYHAEQFRRNEIDGTEINRYRAEIEAQYYLLSVEKLYNIPKEETKQTKDNLDYWKEKLKGALKDES